MKSKHATLVASLAAAFAAGPVLADQEDQSIPHLDHVFVIMMENQYIATITGVVPAINLIPGVTPPVNPNALTQMPFINGYIASANFAANYMGVGHPSLTNYLEVVGASNFGVVNDNSPDWHNATCVSNLDSNTASLEGAANICPIAGQGLDAATPALDTTNEGTAAVPVHNIPLNPAPAVARTIAHQLVEHGLSWKSYQEDLPLAGADGVNNSDGMIVNGAVSGAPNLYAVKHNPFAYFADVQAGTDPELSLAQSVGFDRLYADLKSGDVPNYSLIAPNQCHDQHGRGATEVGPYCQGGATLLQAGDQTVQSLVTAIHASPVWKQGHSAIVVVWDENDYGSESNQVVTIVDTNYGRHGVVSPVAYNHFSLLKTIEAGFRLPYLNHAADKNVPLMKDLFAR